MRRKSLRRFFKSFRQPKTEQALCMKPQSECGPSSANGMKELQLTASLSDNLTLLDQILSDCSDINYRKCRLGAVPSIQAAVVTADGLVDQQFVHTDILKPLMQDTNLRHPDTAEPRFALSLIRDSLLHVEEISELSSVSAIVDCILTGNTVILLDGIPAAVVACTRGAEMRQVSEPITESVVRGPRQGFTENIRTNTALIRKIVKTPSLKMKSVTVGRLTKTELTVAYIQGVADGNIVDEVLRRLQSIEVDSILESGYVEELIEDNPLSPFPQLAHTERPDKAAAELLEGKVIILVDGTPFILIAPVVFIQFLQSSEDYYERYYISFAIRAVRYLFFAIALLLPSLYIAATTYHQEMLPTPLLISIAGAREGVPFPAFIEALMMEITFEALREAGVRLPKPVGSAISIVGALVIGESAVQAGIVSSAMVIVVAITAIASFTIPAFNIAITVRLLRFPMMVLGAVLGFYGIMLGLIAVLIHMCSLQSFGTPYFAPVAPFEWRGMKDTIFRAPWWIMGKPTQTAASQYERKPDTRQPQQPDNVK